MSFAVLAAVLGLLAACGDSSATPDDSAHANLLSSRASEGEAVTVEHAFGATEIDGAPQRIVSLSAQWTDVLLAMGAQPVGHVLEPLAGDDGVYPWQDDLTEDSTGIDAAGASLPLEQIAALDPDLILVSFLAADQPVYDDLAAIAPTIPLLGDRQVDRWQDLAEVAGRFLGEPERAAEVVADVSELMAATAAQLPGLAGKTFALANYVRGDSIYVVADREDGSSVLFQDLGMVLHPPVLAEAEGISGRVQLSLEQAGLLASDLLVIFSNDGDPGDLVGYGQLPAVQRGAVAELDFAAVVGLNTPTPLSVPYSLDFVLPALRAAAGG